MTVPSSRIPVGDRVRLAEARKIVAQETGRLYTVTEFVELCDRLGFKYGRKQGAPQREFRVIRPELATATVTHDQIDEIVTIVTGWNYDEAAS